MSMRGGGFKMTSGEMDDNGGGILKMISWEMDEYGRRGDSTKFQNRKHIGGYWDVHKIFLSKVNQET